MMKCYIAALRPEAQETRSSLSTSFYLLMQPVLSAYCSLSSQRLFEPRWTWSRLIKVRMTMLTIAAGADVIWNAPPRLNPSTMRYQPSTKLQQPSFIHGAQKLKANNNRIWKREQPLAVEINETTLSGLRNSLCTKMSLKYDFPASILVSSSHLLSFSWIFLKVSILTNSIFEQLGNALEQRGLRPPPERTHHIHLPATHITIAQTSECLARKGKFLDI